MLQRRMELEIFGPITQAFRNTHRFCRTHPPGSGVGEVCGKAAEARLTWLDSVLVEREFMAGSRYTIADIAALCGIDFGRVSRSAPSPPDASRPLARSGIGAAERERPDRRVPVEQVPYPIPVGAGLCACRRSAAYTAARRAFARQQARRPATTGSEAGWRYRITDYAPLRARLRSRVMTGLASPLRMNRPLWKVRRARPGLQ